MTQKVLFSLFTIMFGAIAGALGWGFFFLMNNGINFLWDFVPTYLGFVGYPVVLCLIGGLIVGLFEKRFGPYPESLNKVMADIKTTGRYEYDKLGVSFVGALLPLLFGASVGPEAGLTGVIAGLCTWVGDKLRFMRDEFRELSTAGTAAVISAIFTAPLFGLAAPIVGSGDGNLDDETIKVPKATKIIVYLLAIGGALGMMILLGHLFGGNGGLPHFSDINIGWVELMWCIPLAVFAALVGWLFHPVGALFKKVSRALGDRPVIKALIGGAILGVCGMFLPYSMFAGEAQIEELEGLWMGLGAAILILTGIFKVIVTQACLGLGWRGGHFFPLIFAGAALGYGWALILGIDPVFCLCVMSAALMGSVMRQPLMVVLLLFLCFPVQGIFVMLIAAAIGSIIPVPKRWLPEQEPKKFGRPRKDSGTTKQA